jgi:hypothetical protein
MLILTYKSIGKFMVQFVGSDEESEIGKKKTPSNIIKSSFFCKS